MNPKAIAILVMLVSPFVLFGIVYSFGWLLTVLIYILGLHPLSSSRGLGVALSIVIAVMVINYEAHK